MVETRGQRLRRHATLATYLCPDAGHLLPGVPSDCPFGHRRRGRRGGTEPADNLRSVPEGICLNHIKQWNCVKGTEVGCASGLHPTLLELADLDAFLVRANPPRPQHQQGQCVDADSVTCSLAQLKLDSAPPGGPINLLPNELLKSILVRLDMQSLIPKLVVCTKWQAVILSICLTKKGLYLIEMFGEYDDSSDIEEIKRQSFGLIDLFTFTKIIVKPYLGRHLPAQIGKLFPNLESLAMVLDKSDILAILQLKQLTACLKTLAISFTFFCTQHDDADALQILNLINLHSSIKLLCIKDRFGPQVAAVLAPTLARLELFSYSAYSNPIGGYLGPNCSRVSLDMYSLAIVDFAQWHTNVQWLACLTHLELLSINDGDNQVLRLTDSLSKHSTALQVLRLHGSCGSIRMTTRLVANFCKLKHLTELCLSSMCLELPELDRARRNFQLAQLGTVRSFTVHIPKMTSFTGTEVKSAREQGELFVSVLAAMFPNVQNLKVVCVNVPLSGLKSHLPRFPQLKTYSNEF